LTIIKALLIAVTCIASFAAFVVDMQNELMSMTPRYPLDKGVIPKSKKYIFVPTWTTQKFLEASPLTFLHALTLTATDASEKRMLDTVLPASSTSKPGLRSQEPSRLMDKFAPSTIEFSDSESLLASVIKPFTNV
jgi:hypothetical protein